MEMDTARVLVFVGILTNDQTDRCDRVRWQAELRSDGLPQAQWLYLKSRYIYKHTKWISLQTEPVTCARGAAGRAAAHVFPQQLLVIHKLRLIPVCDAIYIICLRVYSLIWDRYYSTVSCVAGGVEGTCALYLCCLVFVCLCMCVCVCVNVPVRVCENERERENTRERVCCYALLHVLPLVSSHEKSWQREDEHT